MKEGEKGKCDGRTSEFSNELPEKLLALTIQPSGAIRISCVKEIDTILHSHVEDLLKLIIHGFPVTPKKLISPCPCSKTHRRYTQRAHLHLPQKTTHQSS